MAEEAINANALTSGVARTTTVRYVPLIYTTPSQKRYQSCRNPFVRWVSGGTDAADYNVTESLRSLSILWDWALQHVMEGSISNRGRPDNEEALDVAIHQGLENLLDGMSDKSRDDLERWQAQRRLNEGYAPPPIWRTHERPPYDIAVIKFPLDGWQESVKGDHRSGLAPQMMKYRYYGFRMTLDRVALDVGSIVKAIACDDGPSAEWAQSGRNSKYRWMRDRATVIDEELRYRRLDLKRKVDDFLNYGISSVRQLDRSLISQKNDETVLKICPAGGLRSSLSRRTSRVSTCVSTSPCSDGDSIRTMSSSIATRQRYTIDNEKPFSWWSLETDTRTMIDRPTLLKQFDTSLTEQTVLGAISFVKARANFQAVLGG